MVFATFLAPLLAGVGYVSAQSTSLNTLAKSAGLQFFGSATDNGEFSDTAYTSILFSSMFGQITPGNSLKWGPTEPSQGTFTYSAPDDILSRAQAAGQIMRGHNLVWHNQLPGWIGSITDATQLVNIMNAHIVSAVGHYKGKLFAWDVVNEPFDDAGGMRSWQYQDIVGDSYISTAFQTARANDGTAKLYLNEYNLEFPGAKYDTALSFITGLVQQGVPIDGVGFQCHLIVGQSPSAAELASQMEKFTSLGLEVAITELDIRMTLPETDALLAQQKTDYQNVVEACLMVDGCVGITVWDFTDKYSWVPGTFSGQGAACPWDENLKTKPAFDGIVAALS